MSAQTPLSPEHLNPLAPEPQDERLPIKKIAIVAAVSLAAFAIGIVWAVSIMVAERGTVSNVQDRKAQFVGRPEIGMVDQTLFTLEKRAVQMAQDKADRLSQYGWVSRKEQLIHMPIAEAMKQVAAGKRPQAGQQPGIVPGTPTPQEAADGGTPTPPGQQ